MHYLIYQITDLDTNMIYIGKHKTNNINDDYMGSSRKLKEEIKNRGLERFRKEILFDFDNYEEMNNKEKELVNEEFVMREDTYNLNLGGSGGWYECNRRGENNKNGQHLIAGLKCKSDPEFRKRFCKNISEGIKRYIAEHPGCQAREKNHMYGRHHSEESKRLMSKNRTGENNGSFGTFWITNSKLKKNMKWKDRSKLPEGWVIGRKFYNGENLSRGE